MRDTITILDQINRSFDFSIRHNSLSNRKALSGIELNSELYNRLVARAQGEFGREVLVFSISPENYMRYKNGKVSSIVKNETGFKSHEGFEAVRMVNIVDSIFTEVTQFVANKIMSEFQLLEEQIFLSINQMQRGLLSHLMDLKEQGYIEDLVSFQDFFSEINDDLGNIAISTKRSSAYISNLIDIRRKVYKVYSYFINNLTGWPQKIYGFYSLANIDYEKIQNDYYWCRQAISCYMITLVYEHVLAGSIDEQSCEKIVNSIERFLRKFNDIDAEIKQALNQRDFSNRSWNWLYWQDKQHDSQSIYWFLRQIESDQNFEITKVREVFERSKELLSSVPIFEAKARIGDQ